jgi:hypothetical protein
LLSTDLTVAGWEIVAFLENFQAIVAVGRFQGRAIELEDLQGQFVDAFQILAQAEIHHGTNAEFAAWWSLCDCSKRNETAEGGPEYSIFGLGQASRDAGTQSSVLATIALHLRRDGPGIVIVEDDLEAAALALQVLV